VSEAKRQEIIMTEKSLLLICAFALLIGLTIGATDAIGRSAGTGADEVVTSNLGPRDAYGVAIIKMDDTESVAWEDSSFLKNARLRADLNDAIRVR
jgi:hypothetical protein